MHDQEHINRVFTISQNSGVSMIDLAWAVTQLNEDLDQVEIAAMSVKNEEYSNLTDAVNAIK